LDSLGPPFNSVVTVALLGRLVDVLNDDGAVGNSCDLLAWNAPIVDDVAAELGPVQRRGTEEGDVEINHRQGVVVDAARGKITWLDEHP
jgi:hypothetical protein